MPIKTIGGFPCRHCGCSFVEVNTDRDYYWVDFGVVLIDAVTNYTCKNCKNILVQVIKIKEKKFDHERLKRKRNQEATDQQPQFLQGYPPMIFTGIWLSGYKICKYHLLELLSLSNFLPFL